jgi:hypothetical protein
MNTKKLNQIYSVRGLDPKLWKKARIEALKAKKTMAEFITEAIEAKLK